MESDSKRHGRAHGSRSWFTIFAQREDNHASQVQGTADGSRAALSARRGEQKVSELDGAARSMYDSMSEEELEKMASTSREDKPRHDNQS